MATALALLLLALVLGSSVFCVLVIMAARAWIAVRPHPAAELIPISILKPLAGVDLGLEANLRGFFTQDYPDFEILFAVRTPEDPAVGVVQRLQQEYPHIPSTLIFTGEPPYANAKVYSLDKMMQAARNDVIVMSDSDIRTTDGMLRAVAAEFADPKLGVATCPYRAVAGPSLWSDLEAWGMNTEFIGGVLVARLLEGMKFAVGPTIVARKQAIQDIGGFDRLKDYLAEDFVMGAFAAEKGWTVILSSFVVEHRIGSEPVDVNIRHRIRWARSTRRSRPAGYIGQLFTNPFPLVIALLLLRRDWWPAALFAMTLRMMAGYVTAGFVLNAALGPREWIMILVQDLLSFIFWVAGFFGKTIEWRGRKYSLLPDGRFELIADEVPTAAP